MELAFHIWIVGDDTVAQESVVPDTNDDDVDASLVTARASQRKKSRGLYLVHRKTTMDISLLTQIALCLTFAIG